MPEPVAYMTSAEWKVERNPADFDRILSSVPAANRDATLTGILAQASALIDDACMNRYQLPLNPTLGVKHFVEHQAWELLLHRAPWNLSDNETEIIRGYRQELKDLAKRVYNFSGQVELGSPLSATNVRPSDRPSTTCGRRAVFTPERMRDY